VRFIRSRATSELIVISSALLRPRRLFWKDFTEEAEEEGLDRDVSPAVAVAVASSSDNMNEEATLLPLLIG
jgi:hypothetical protein